MSAELTSATLAEHGIAELADELRSWIQRSRWFGLRERTGLSLEIDDVATLREADPTVLLTFWRVEAPGHDPATFSVPLGIRRSPHSIGDYGPEHLIGEVNGLLVYDALVDTEAAAELWRLLSDERTLNTERGRVVAHADTAIDAGDLDAIHMLSVEQSNSALVRGSREFLKWLRRLDHGASVELEMTGVLQERNFPHSPQRLGHLAYYRGDGPPALQALLQEYLHNSAEGWTMALTSLRDLYADAEEFDTSTALERQEFVDNQGSSFIAEARRLGEVTGELHLLFADSALEGEMAPSPIEPRMLDRWATTMIGELDALLASRNPAVAPLADQRAVIVARFEALRSLHNGGQAIRIHGDYHLGQVVRTDEGWRILDFEGEPNRSVEERRMASSPLRDVAGMLRSFDYAAAAALAERMALTDPRWDAMFAQGDAWASASREAFWAAYLQRTAGADLLPEPGAALTLRRAFELQKAIYEIGYELGHRPDWVGIPLHFLLAGS